MEQSTEPQGFIPGLPDDLVLDHIATRIPWSSMYPLTWVNQRWRRAIRSRQVYETRKRNGMSQLMFVAPMEAARIQVTRNSELDRLPVQHPLASVWQTWGNTQAGFYDVENGDLYMFPSEGDPHVAEFRPPGFQTTASVECRAQGADGLNNALKLPPNLYPRLQGQIHVPGGRAYNGEGMVILDGKVYAMQAFFSQEGGHAEKVVKVLDIGACNWEWRLCSRPDRCPNQGNDKNPISWAVCNGKFYCFHTCNKRLHGEVFDPETDTWREIEDRSVNPFHVPEGFIPMRSQQRQRHHPRLLVLNEEIQMAFRWEQEIMIFNSVTEKWRLNTTIVIPHDIGNIHRPHDHSFTGYCSMIVFNGKLYNFVRDFVLVYNQESSSWTELQRTFHKDFVEETKKIREMSVVAFYNNEVVAMLDTSYYYFWFPDGTQRKFCKSVGFGIEGEVLIWEQFPRSCFKNCLYTGQSDSRFYTYAEPAEGFWDLKPDIILDYAEL